jgi:DNA modification methylase
MEVIQVKVSDLKYDAKNARKHDAQNIEAIKYSLTKFGQQKPIVVSKDNIVIAGNGTLAAAHALGWEEINCYITDLEGDAAKAYAIADNRTAELADWDMEVLATSLDELQKNGFDTSELCFEDLKLESTLYKSQENEDEVPEVTFSVSVLGDLWILGNHRVLCGDSTDIKQVEKLMGGEKADMVFTDPPYELTSGGDSGLGKGMFKKTIPNYKNSGKLFGVPEFNSWIPHVNSYTKTSVDVYIMSNDKNIADVISAMNTSGIRLHNILVMGKDTHCPNRWYLKNCEFVVYGFIGTAKAINDMSSFALQLVKMPRNEKTHHSEKPVSYIANLVTNSSETRSVVVDPFLGSGSTLIACEKTNRKCYGMEIDPHYVDVIIKRWQDFTGKEAFTEIEGKQISFNQLKSIREVPK